MAYAALVSLANAIDRNLNHNLISIYLEENQRIISLCEYVTLFQAFLEKFPDKFTSLEGRMREVARQAEYIIKRIVLEKVFTSSEDESGCQTSGKHELELEKVLEEIDLIAGEMKKIEDGSSSKNVQQHGAHSSSLSSSSSDAPAVRKEAMVGFEEYDIEIKERLLSGSSKLQVIPIWGMGGIGKTTLAKNIYDDPLTIMHFRIRVWVTISQDYSKQRIISSLLESVKEFYGGRSGDSDDCRVRKTLMLMRYLVVMDDIWNCEAWDVVRRVFGDSGNGSRIMLTTRLSHVASYPNPRSKVYEMHLMDADQSWHLFQRKVFADQTCPLELQSIGKKIVRSCGGLPLSIVSVAERLSRIGPTPKLWEQFVATDGDGQLESILSLSYIQLPRHLKVCFLYMAGFPEDDEIRLSELIKLWVAEGFLVERPYESKSLEEMAEEYLEDLVERSLVLVTSRKIDGKIKSCRLHNMVRNLCVRQAGQKKFLLPVMDYLPTPILRRHFLPQVLKNHRRISVTWYDLDLKDSMHSSCTHSIICIPQKGYRPKGSVGNFSSLRVLHVLRRNDHSYWELGQVFDLIHLTYLASNIPSSIVPPAISKLQNLQTLIIYRYGVRLPVQIWRMQLLRHLISFSFDPLPHPEAADPLENLETLSLATNFVCSERMVEMIPNVRKLGICYFGEKFYERYNLNSLTHLLRLEKLKLEMHSGSFWPSRSPVFPMSLKKLTLSGCLLPWRGMTAAVGSLPNLEVLKLRNHACDGEHWEITEGDFGALKLLLIDESNLRNWTTESSRFRRLKYLILHRCPYLSEIPSDIADIPTLELELIEVDDLNQSLFSSAQKIQEKRQEYRYGHVEVRLKRF